MAKILEVYLHDRLAGQLEQDRSGALWFTYNEEWIAAGVPLSASLPLRAERFKASECRPFFAGLLPEENSRRLIASALGVSDRNDFALLARIGAECAGAVSLLESGSPPPAERHDYRPMSDADLAARLSEIPTRPLLAGEDGVRLSLAGAQGKMALALFGGEYFLPLDGSPSTHIIKPQSQRFGDLVENEFACMTLASRVGLDVAEVEIGDCETHRFLKVRRYDRIGQEKLTRIHQEDFCQALGLPPEMKYQEEGGPNFKTCFQLVRRISASPAADALKLFDAVVFNFLIGNCDAHGKNFSFLYGAEGPRLAPLYDLVCTRAYPELSSNMAMRIGGEKNPARIFARHWEQLIAETGFNPAASRRRVLGLVKKVEDELGRASIEIPESLQTIVSGNCDSLRLSVSKD